MSMAFLSEEDVATIPPDLRQELVARGLLAPNQPGLTAPYVAPEDSGTGGGGTGGGDGTGTGGTGGTGTGTTGTGTGTTGTGTTGTGTTGTGTTGTGTTGTGTTGGPRFYGTNPELLGSLDSLLAELRGYAGTAGAGLIDGGEGEVAGFQSGTFSFEDVRGALLNRLSQARRAVAGTSTETPTAVDSDAAFRAAQLAQQRTDAFSRLQTLLSRFGLGELQGAVQNIITSGAVDISDPNAIIFAIRGESAYKRRFAANEARVRKGLPELDPASYVGLEEAYRDLMRANGLPVGFYDQQSDFQKLIEGDVSAAELQGRIQQGYRRVRDADPEVRRQMRELYNVDDQALTAYFLDPEKAAPLLERQARAAEIAARGREQARLQLTATQAEQLAARGITAEEAQARFAERGALEGLYTPMTGEQAISDELGATFGYNVQARQDLERRRRERLAEFQGGGGFARTTGATSGTVETGAGTAQ